MKRSLSNDLTSWTRKEIEEGLKNNSLNEDQKRQAKDLLIRFSPIKVSKSFQDLDIGMQELKEGFYPKKTTGLSESIQNLRNWMVAYNNKNEKEFQKTVKTVKHILKSKNFVLPRDWQKVFYEWYVEKYRDELIGLSWDDLTEKMKDERIIIEWAESYTKELIQEKTELEKPEKGEPLAVRYTILNEFFNESDQFKNLSEKQKEQILAYILGTIPRTAKGIKNGEQKYFSNGHKSRAKELINKIKKGEIL